MSEKCAELCTPEVLDLAKQMLVYDHNLRITAREALNHPFFNSIRGKL